MTKEGYINIFDNDGMYQSGSGIYNDLNTAKEAGLMVKGYIDTIFIKFEAKNEKN